MKLRKLRNVFFSLLALIIIVAASVSALLETETGSHWLVKKAASFAAIQVGALSGNLRRGLDVEFIDYQVEEQHYRAEQVSFRWRLIDLFYSAVEIQSLQVEKLLVHIPVAVDEPANKLPFTNWPRLHLPVRIQLDRFRINNIEFVQGEVTQRWQSLSGSLTWGTFHLRYNNLALIHPDYAVHLSGVSNVDYPYVTVADAQWHWQMPLSGATTTTTTTTTTTVIVPPIRYAGTAQLTGDLRAIKLHNQITSPVALVADAQVQLVNEQHELQPLPALTLALSWQEQTLPAAWWVANQAVPLTSGKLTAQGHWQAYQVQLQGDLHLPQAPALAISGVATGDLQSIQVDFLQVHELLAGNAVAEPATAPITIVDTNSNASSSASSLNNSAPVNTLVNNALAPLMLDKKLIQGVRLSGSVRWLPQLQWQVDVDAKRLNLASVLEDWRSDLNASLQTQGRMDASTNTWQAALKNLNVEGELRGVNVQGNGNLDFDGKSLRTDALTLILGANQFQLKGDIGEHYNLDWYLSAPMLQQVNSSMRGSITSKGELRGSAQQPRLQLQAAVQKFSWKNYSLEKLEVSLAPVMAAAVGVIAAQEQTATNSPPLNTIAQEILDSPYQLTFVANQLRLASNRFSTVQINGAGTLKKHNIKALIKSTNYGRTDIKVVGGYDGAEWLGKLDQFALKVKKVPRWWLMSSQPIRINADAVQLGSQCLTTRTNLTGAVEGLGLVEDESLINEWIPNQSPVKNAYDWLVTKKTLPSGTLEKYALPQLCIRGDWSVATGAQFNAQLDSVPLRQFLSLFKTEVFFAGVMDGSLTLTGKDFALENINVLANIATRNAELRYQYAGGTTEVYAWRDFSVRADIKNAQLNVVAGMEWVDYGRIDANAQVDLAKQLIQTSELHAVFSNLAPLETLLNFANDVKGDLRADLSVGGSFAQPYLLGDISLRNGSANLPRLGIDLTNMDMHITSAKTGSINWAGQLQSDKGKVSITGDLHQFGTAQWNMQGVISGSDFQIINLPQLKATLSPDINIIANKELLKLTGNAVIPWARTNIKSLPTSATKVSDDAVIVDEKFAQDSAESPMKFLTNLNLILGDDVNFKGFGLSSKVKGKVNLLKEPQRQFFTSGYVSVTDGSYKAYGQNLTVDRGRLIFQGSYENPALEIRASRMIRDEENTKVGLDINGTLQNPKATVFATPAGPSDSDAMKMLMTGKPAGDFTKGDASLLLSAMSGLGMDTGGSIAAEITQFFRVDELEIKSDQGLEQSELWVGKYITPRLLVRYVVGLFDSAFSLGMEYQLTNSLRLEAISGEAQSVDVIYKIER